MKRLYVIVEGQTEQEFAKEVMVPYLRTRGILGEIKPILIHTSKYGKGGFVNYQHLKNDVIRLLKSENNDCVVTMFVDFFRCPKVPFPERWERLTNHQERVEEMEKCIDEDIKDRRFIPYIQLHEFEALLFSSDAGFREYFTNEEQLQIQHIIDAYPNPEEINSSPEGAPSKRIIAIREEYDKVVEVVEGNLIALHVGMENILAKCPRFKNWIEKIIAAMEK